MTGEYTDLYEKGPVKVGLVVSDTSTGETNGSPNLQLEGILVNETKSNLVFQELKSTAMSETQYSPGMRMIRGKKSYVRKDHVAVIYTLKD